MSIFDILDDQEKKKKPSVEELYGYEEDQLNEDERNENFLDRLVNDIKTKQQNQSIRSREFTR